MLDSQKILDLKEFWVKKDLGQKKILVNTAHVSQIDCCSYSSCDMGHLDPPPKLSQKPMSSLCVKFQPSSTPPSARF